MRCYITQFITVIYEVLNLHLLEFISNSRPDLNLYTESFEENIQSVSEFIRIFAVYISHFTTCATLHPPNS
jgi:hypothetical protein